MYQSLLWEIDGPMLARMVWFASIEPWMIPIYKLEKRGEEKSNSKDHFSVRVEHWSAFVSNFN